MLNTKFDIVGSFLRPQEIKEARAKYNAGEITLAQLRGVEDAAIADLVTKEVQHGLTMVTDGEFRRRWWHLDWLKEFDGFTTQHLDAERNGVVNHIELGYIDGIPKSMPTISLRLRLRSIRASRPRSVFRAPT